MVLTGPALTTLGRDTGARSASASYCALVAGANAPIRRLLRTLLAMGGFEVAEACTPNDVLRRLDTLAHPPRVFVLDVGPPLLSSLTTLSFVRREPRLSNVPLVVLTSALADPPEHAHFVRHGATAILSKPFSSQRLLDIVRTLARPCVDNELRRGADGP